MWVSVNALEGPEVTAVRLASDAPFTHDLSSSAGRVSGLKRLHPEERIRRLYWRDGAVREILQRGLVLKTG